jgi:hypothetical protein
MINLGLLALGATVLLLLQLVAAVEARTRALPTVPRSGVASARRRPDATGGQEQEHWQESREAASPLPGADSLGPIVDSR